MISSEERRLLRMGHKDAVLLSAMSRETTHGLLAKIAERLKGRWAGSALVPSYEVEDAEDEGDSGDSDESGLDAVAGADPGAADGDGELTTLGEMMGGRHRRKVLGGSIAKD
jgi:hypothetical protein